MKKSELYLLLSIIAIVLTFVNGLGFILSIIVLFLNNSEKNKLLIQNQTVEIKKELNKIRISYVLSVINISISIILIISIAVLTILFGYLFIDGNGWIY